MRYPRILACSALLFFSVLSAQSQKKEATDAVLTADSLKSGNTKDILTSFFQLAFNNLAGPNKELAFNSNPFAIMLKRNPSLALDKNYKRYKPLRKLNFNFGIRLDSSFNFNGFTSGLRYSLIDQTDATTSKLIAQKLKQDPVGLERDVLSAELDKYQQLYIPDITAKQQFLQKVNDLFQDKALNKFDAPFQHIVDSIVKDKKLDDLGAVFSKKAGKSLKEVDLQYYSDLKASIKKNLLWTFSITDSTYKDKFEFANIALTTELTKGIFEPQAGDNNLELNIKALVNFSNDTLEKGRNLSRKIFSIESGLNWVIRDRSNDRSFFELKFSGSYYRNLANLYQNERRDSLTINGKARIRIWNDIWIPLEVKYDPKTGKFVGLLDIKANFAGIANLIRNAGKNQ